MTDGMQRRKRRLHIPGKQGDESVPLGEKINSLLTEARIVLPGVQALLGFQLVAYLTDAFGEALRHCEDGAHGMSFLLALAMILLITPACYHRLAEDGEDTEHFDRVGTAFVLAALPPS